MVNKNVNKKVIIVKKRRKKVNKNLNKGKQKGKLKGKTSCSKGRMGWQSNKKYIFGTINVKIRLE